MSKLYKLVVFLSLIFVVVSCSINGKSKGPILLRLSPSIGSEYEVTTNMNVALEMKHPINLNMDFIIHTKFDSITQDKKLAMTSKISRIKSIASSGIFHKSYDTDHPIIEGEIEQQMHDRLSVLIGVKMNALMSLRGETEQITNLDSLFKEDEEMKTQFKEIETSFSNSGVEFPLSEVKVGSKWHKEIKNESVQNMIQKLTYKVLKIYTEEVIIDISGVISYGSEEVSGGGKISGIMKIDRSTGLSKLTKITQDYRMNINGYKAIGVNTLEIKTKLIKY